MVEALRFVVDHPYFVVWALAVVTVVFLWRAIR